MKKILIQMLKIYKNYVSPFIIRSCRYNPTCSEYAVEAIESYGILKGVPMAMCRILRCNPFSKGGYDPVKKNKSKELLWKKG